MAFLGNVKKILLFFPPLESDVEGYSLMIADSPSDKQESPFKNGGSLGKYSLGAERKKSSPTYYY